MRKRHGIKTKQKRLYLPGTEPIANGSPAKAKEGRNALGQFATGNVGGPGNPLIARVQRYRQILFACLTEKAFARIVKRLIQLAEDGDLAAAKILLDRGLGRVPVDAAAEALKHEEYDPDESFL